MDRFDAIVHAYLQAAQARARVQDAIIPLLTRQIAEEHCEAFLEQAGASASELSTEAIGQGLWDAKRLGALAQLAKRYTLDASVTEAGELELF